MRWNYAFWLQNALAVVPEGESAGARLWKEALDEERINYTDEDEENDYDRCSELAERISDLFLDLVVEVAKDSHSGGVIESAFGRKIPVLVHELEYYKAVVDRTVKANSPGSAAPFASWIRGL